ncbi:NACHT domain-containing protein [Streptomyces sp. NPDC059909]|uniref:NACHT domain-containing protein n=1 Tax=Streptomyces sp. NPDC059909 TaxID=3346998 RepID=UPI003667F246
MVQGLEVALARLAGTVIGSVARSLLAPRPGAGLVRAPLRPLPRPAGPDRLAKVLGGRLQDAYGGLPEHERLAAVDAVRDSFAAAGVIDAERLFAVGLDPERLRDTLRRVPEAAGLSARADELYEELLGLCCTHLVEQVTAQPSFAARAAVEQTRAAGRTLDAVEALAAQAARTPAAAALEFEQRYAEYVAATHGRLELFGLTLGRSAREWPLDTAYISLGVSGDAGHQEGFELPHTGQATVKAEQMLAAADRLVLRGPAGSGKSTLVQWLALNAARRGFDGALADWNRCIPFVLRLRAFTSADALPTPEDFLRASGVPLSAPAGWAEDLLAGGRALVLVDGVDEVPTRLRQRTESWLRSLVTAFPQARYVVTTRPSVVPGDWPARQGFTAHSLLPMDRDDIRAFIGHWHEAARLECPDGTERDQLEAYEASLLQAVSTRRDLGRLATNPLMCALLCALNRDRRMQLPRARKELYDAALDMLLVRRDTEREIIGVEGVDLTREEQTALLQRLAYWLIRNGQWEADRAEAVEMVAEWLTSMPQVRGTAEQVFSHLLIRSGLLCEPAPGAVDFVHRTFQDYLGAKAAVEARDFGVLVRNAHDDQWDDVVQMAVGHARAEERARLLKQLLRRADRAPKLRHRLVLLAAACLEHAPELDPEVRVTVRARTRELVPPRSLEQAEELAKVGPLVLELLPGPEEGLDEDAAAAVVRTAALVGGDAGMEVVARFREDERYPVCLQLSHAWRLFDTEDYARAVVAGGTWEHSYLHVRTVEQLSALRHAPKARSVHLTGDHTDLTALHVLRNPRAFLFHKNAGLTDLSPLGRFPGLKGIAFDQCTGLTDLSPVAGPALEQLYLHEMGPDVRLEPLREMTGLDRAVFGYAVPVRTVGELPIGPQLTELGLLPGSQDVRLDGIERWPELRDLTVVGDRQGRQVAAMPSLAGLTRLRFQMQSSLDLRRIVHLTELDRLIMWRCEVPSGLDALRELPGLTSLWLSECTGPEGGLDLRPLLGLEQLVLTLSGGTPVTGDELFPPGRIVRRGQGGAGRQG